MVAMDSSSDGLDPTSDGLQPNAMGVPSRESGRPIPVSIRFSDFPPHAATWPAPERPPLLERCRCCGQPRPRPTRRCPVHHKHGSFVASEELQQLDQAPYWV
ncbi:unnamed protein product [Durusdinium trenchii]|uniref:Uncharacterized protein n=1 Tax=Durusdinium trenchii TaxID=1381693 RepID=A0ABP0MYE6_9DINO